jgi:palmitoyltransferase
VRILALRFSHVADIASSPWYTLLIPLRVPPYTDGRAWARREGYTVGHGGIRAGEELTDEDD